MTIQPRNSLAIITANAAASAFVCTIAAMQGIALETCYMVMDDARTHADLRVPFDTGNANPKRWETVVDANSPRAV